MMIEENVLSEERDMGERDCIESMSGEKGMRTSRLRQVVDTVDIICMAVSYIFLFSTEILVRIIAYAVVFLCLITLRVTEEYEKRSQQRMLGAGRQSLWEV